MCERFTHSNRNSTEEETAEGGGIGKLAAAFYCAARQKIPCGIVSIPRGEQSTIKEGGNVIVQKENGRKRERQNAACRHMWMELATNADQKRKNASGEEEKKRTGTSTKNPQ